jgi:hypothetical protein
MQIAVEVGVVADDDLVRGRVRVRGRGRGR